MCVVIFGPLSRVLPYWLMERIGVMGAHGSFSEQAGQMYVTTEALLNATLVPLINAEGVFSALDRGEIERGIIHVMNNNGGIVEEAMQAMAKYIFEIQGFLPLMCIICCSQYQGYRVVILL